MKRILALLSIAAICLVVAHSAPRAADTTCETCDADALQACTDKAKQHDWKKKKLNQCIAKESKVCKTSCKKAAKTPTPAAGTAPAEKIEDNPCYVYCRNQCGSPEADTCVLDCVQRASCTPH